MENQIMKINDENLNYTSMTLASKRDKVTFYNAIQNPSSKLSEHINKKISFVHVAMSACEIQEKDDLGNPIPDAIHKTVKTIFVTPEGNGIITTSMGVARALLDMFNIFGTPDTWDEPMTCLVKQVEIGKNRTFKLEVC
jgi:hypothetical protein